MQRRKEPSAIGILREEILLRDGFSCVPCCILGYCEPKGQGWCGGNQLVAWDLQPAIYFRLDGLRTNASLRLHLSHLRGKAHDEWRNMVASCPCHNERISKEIREACLTYTAQFPETGTERFEAALARRPQEKAAKKTRDAATRHAAYEYAKAKKTAPTIPGRKQAKPKRDKKKSKWNLFPIRPAERLTK